VNGKKPLAILRACHNLKSMGHKRRPTEHQRQIRFLAILFGAVMIIAVIAMMLWWSRPVGGYH
jgi:hypothetical protein